MTNPWKTLDLARFARFGSENEIDAAVERHQIASEYQHGPDSEPCGYAGCSETAHYRPTVGTVMCPKRHGLALNGQWRAL